MPNHRHIVSLILSCFAFAGLAVGQEVCTEVNWARSYETGKRVSFNKSISTADGGSLHWGGETTSESLIESIALLKLDGSGDVKWSTQINSVIYHFTEVECFESSDGKIWIGGVGILEQNRSETVFITATLSAVGQLEFARYWRADLNRKKGEISLMAKPIADKQGSVYFSFNYNYTNSSRPGISLVFKLTSAGQLQWDRSFLLPAGSSNAARFHSLQLKGDSLLMFSNTGALVSYLGMSLLKSNGSVLLLHAYQPEEFIKWPGGNDLIPLGQENYLCTGYYFPLSGERNDVEASFVIFNKHLEPVNCIQMRTFDVDNANGWGWAGKKIVADGEQLYFGISRPSERSFYLAGFNAQFQPTLQKKIQYNFATGQIASGAPLSYAKNDRLFFRSLISQPVSGEYALSLASVNSGISLDNNCYSAIDTSFIKLSQFRLQKRPFEWESIQDNVLGGFHHDLLQTSLVVQQNAVCEEIQVCPTPKISGSPRVCISGEEVIYTAEISSGCFNAISWVVDSSGYYSCRVIDRNTIAFKFSGNWQGKLIAKLDGSCDLADTIEISAILPQRPDLFPHNGNSLVVCKGQNDTLFVSPSYQNIRWQDGSTGSTMAVKQPGKYWVWGKDGNGCEVSDTVNVKAVQSTPVGFLPRDTTICEGEFINLAPMGTFGEYKWSNGSNSSNIQLYKPGVYHLNVTDNDGCTGTDSIEVRFNECGPPLIFPNAFSPDGNGHNDLFRPILQRPVSRYFLRIYNRFGQVVFTSSDPRKGWNGLSHGNRQTPSLFTWVCEYMISGQRRVDKGIVHLIY